MAIRKKKLISRPVNAFFVIASFLFCFVLFFDVLCLVGY